MDVVNLLRQKPAGRRRVTSCDCAEESLFELSELGRAEGLGGSPEGEGGSGSSWRLPFDSLKKLLEMIVEDGNAALATDMFRVLGGGSRSQFPFTWDFDASEARPFLIICLIRSLYADAALTFLENSCKVSLPGPGCDGDADADDQASFGAVVSCPYCAGGESQASSSTSATKALSVVKPYQGSETMVCSSCRYEYDLFSGAVREATSEAPETYV